MMGLVHGGATVWRTILRAQEQRASVSLLLLPVMGFTGEQCRTLL